MVMIKDKKNSNKNRNNIKEVEATKIIKVIQDKRRMNMMKFKVKV
jgi:hypothetical protein